ncbi:hypothetical protein J4419_06355 [Candidatus Woesearchaeota archaeon]|nr:hypothetical protein [Candidatus Woesearchaeota archaeon]
MKAIGTQKASRFSQQYLSAVASEHQSALAEAGALLASFEGAGLSSQSAMELASHAERYASIPVGIFRSELGPLEAVVKYCRDVLQLPVQAIARLTHRSASTVSISYRNAVAPLVIDLELKDINFRKLRVPRPHLFIPGSALAPELSILEAVCLYLHTKAGLRFADIARLLHRDQRTIYTVVSRARRKR